MFARGCTSLCVRAGNACLIDQGLHRKALELLAMRLEVRAVSATLAGRGVVRNTHGRLYVVCATECGDRRSSSQAIGSARGVPEGEELARGVVGWGQAQRVHPSHVGVVIHVGAW